MGRTNKKIYCQGNICWRCVLAAHWIVKLGLIKFGDQAKPLNYSEKVVFPTNLQQMFKRTDTERDTQRRKKQQADVCAKNAKLLCDGCCCLNEKGIEILFRINIPPPLTAMVGLDGAGQ